MTQFKIYNSEEYRKHKIILRNIIDTSYWEYIVCINGEIYSSSVDISPKTFWRRFICEYTDKEIEDIVNYVKSMAMATIDMVAFDGKPDPTEEKRTRAEAQVRESLKD